MRFANVYRLIHFSPWLILPQAHDAIVAVLASKLANEQKADGFFDDFVVNRRAATMTSDGIGCVHMLGPVGSGMSKIEKTCGATDLGDFSAEFTGLVAQGARGIMMDIDSPGGSVYGTAEVAQLVADCEVPVVAHVDSGLMCSAAYWAGCSADRIYATASSEIGSIGVYIPWADQTARYKMAGVKMDLITNTEGTYKGAGYPGTELTEKQRESWQLAVDRIYDNFSGAVREARGDLSVELMRGQTFGAQESADNGLIDGVATRESAMNALRSLISNAS